MSGHDSHVILERAFESFERAATHLGQRHAALERQVVELEDELVDSHRRLEAVLNALDTGVATVDASGELLRTNRAFDRLGLDRALWTPLVETEGGAGRTERLVARTSSGERLLTLTLIPVGDQEGTRVLTVHDVTEVRRVEEEDGRRLRLEALGRMAAELAHEVRNPLGSMRLFGGMLHDDLEDRPELQSMADQILTATDGLEGLVSNLLAFAAPPRGARRPLDLAALGREACALVAPASVARGVTLASPADDDRCVLVGEMEGLRQVLLNLLGNALVATQSGGRIAVRTRVEGNRAVLEVIDDGCGIAADDLPRVFDPFFSRTAGGTGLGLSIVHGIVERHDGRIALDSEPARGTRVRVELPLLPTLADEKEMVAHHG